MDLGTENPQYCWDPAEPLAPRLRDAGTVSILPARRGASLGAVDPPDLHLCSPQPFEEVPPPSVDPQVPSGAAGGRLHARTVFSPARFPPLASVTGAGAEMGGAWGRHKCATAASSLPWLHPSRLLTVALATSYRWGIYRGWEAGGGWIGNGWASARSASSFRLLSACVGAGGMLLPLASACAVLQLFLLAGAGRGGQEFACGNKNKRLGRLPFSPALLVLGGLCAPP